jgi:hypothetical protein
MTAARPCLASPGNRGVLDGLSGELFAASGCTQPVAHRAFVRPIRRGFRGFALALEASVTSPSSPTIHGEAGNKRSGKGPGEPLAARIRGSHARDLGAGGPSDPRRARRVSQSQNANA